MEAQDAKAERLPPLDLVIDRYLRTLRILLPQDQRDDIIRELSEEIQSQVAEREAALGRRLAAEEQAAIVAQYGHPLLTAARYRPSSGLSGWGGSEVIEFLV